MRCREVKVPLSPKAKLSWIGYSDKGSPVTYDTMSVLRMYNFKSNLWYPICDLRLHVSKKSFKDSYLTKKFNEILVFRQKVPRIHFLLSTSLKTYKLFEQFYVEDHPFRLQVHVL